MIVVTESFELTDFIFDLVHPGRQSVLTLSSGLKIGAFGGRFSLESFTSDSTALTNPEYSQASLESFISQPSTSNLDILLLNSWPSQLTRFSEKPITSFSKEQVSSWSVPAINKLLMKAKPKYAFVSSQNLFWEREPFVYPAPSRDQASSAASMMQEQQQHATRFLSLGHFANAAKERNFYAFSIAPGPVMELPPNVTPCPFEDSSSQRGKKRALPDAAEEDGGGNSYIFAGVENARTSANGQRKHGEPPASYKCKICGIPGHFIQVSTIVTRSSQFSQVRIHPPRFVLRSAYVFCRTAPRKSIKRRKPTMASQDRHQTTTSADYVWV